MLYGPIWFWSCSWWSVLLSTPKGHSWLWLTCLANTLQVVYISHGIKCHGMVSCKSFAYSLDWISCPCCYHRYCLYEEWWGLTSGCNTRVHLHLCVLPRYFAFLCNFLSADKCGPFLVLGFLYACTVYFKTGIHLLGTINNVSIWDSALGKKKFSDTVFLPFGSDLSILCPYYPD